MFCIFFILREITKSAKEEGNSCKEGLGQIRGRLSRGAAGHQAGRGPLTTASGLWPSGVGTMEGGLQSPPVEALAQSVGNCCFLTKVKTNKQATRMESEKSLLSRGLGSQGRDLCTDARPQKDAVFSAPGRGLWYRKSAFLCHLSYCRMGVSSHLSDTSVSWVTAVVNSTIFIYLTCNCN